jgi:hypothetical protein
MGKVPGRKTYPRVQYTLHVVLPDGREVTLEGVGKFVDYLHEMSWAQLTMALKDITASTMVDPSTEKEIS